MWRTVKDSFFFLFHMFAQKNADHLTSLSPPHQPYLSFGLFLFFSCFDSFWNDDFPASPPQVIELFFSYSSLVCHPSWLQRLSSSSCLLPFPWASCSISSSWLSSSPLSLKSLFLQSLFLQSLSLQSLSSQSLSLQSSPSLQLSPSSSFSTRHSFYELGPFQLFLLRHSTCAPAQSSC